MTRLLRSALVGLVALSSTAFGSGCTKNYLIDQGINVSMGRDTHSTQDEVFVQPAVIAYALSQRESNIGNYYRVIASWEGKPEGGFMMAGLNQAAQQHFANLAQYLDDTEKAAVAEATAAKDWARVGDAYASMVARLVAFPLSQSVLDYGKGRLGVGTLTTEDFTELKMAANGMYVMASKKAQTVTFEFAPPHQTIQIPVAVTYDVSEIEGVFECNAGDDGQSFKDQDPEDFIKDVPAKCKILKVQDIAPKLKKLEAPKAE